jgi:hypothetical protein
MTISVIGVCIAHNSLTLLMGFQFYVNPELKENYFEEHFNIMHLKYHFYFNIR